SRRASEMVLVRQGRSPARASAAGEADRAVPGELAAACVRNAALAHAAVSATVPATGIHSGPGPSAMNPPAAAPAAVPRYNPAMFSEMAVMAASGAASMTPACIGGLRAHANTAQTPIPS